MIFNFFKHRHPYELPSQRLQLPTSLPPSSCACPFPTNPPVFMPLPSQLHQLLQLKHKYLRPVCKDIRKPNEFRFNVFNTKDLKLVDY